MADLNRLLAENLATAFLVLGAAVLLLLALVIVQSLRLRRATHRYERLVQGADGAALPEVLEAHIGQVRAVRAELEELNRLHEQLERRSRGSLQHIGLVRFNPFEDTGSDQSFALALLDDEHDGVVVSSLHGRTTTRLYAKPVEGAASRHSLSDEEAQAIRVAVEGTNPVAG